MRRFFIILVMLLTVGAPAYAEYVLPYPSYMPGNKLYKISRIIDDLKQYWYWGNIAQAKYHQALSDKYLVEAKTLFEYGQYPLALDALARSDEQLQKVSSKVIDARKAHVALLTKLLTQSPETFVWQDEHKAAITLDLSGALGRSLKIRNE